MAAGLRVAKALLAWRVPSGEGGALESCGAFGTCGLALGLGLFFGLPPLVSSRRELLRRLGRGSPRRAQAQGANMPKHVPFRAFRKGRREMHPLESGKASLCTLTDHNPLPARACTLQILQQLRNPHEIDGSGFFVAVFTKTLHRAFPLEIPRQPSLGSQIPWRARPGHTEVPAHPFPPYRQEPEQLLRPRLARKPRCPVDCHLDSSSGCKAV